MAEYQRSSDGVDTSAIPASDVLEGMEGAATSVYAKYRASPTKNLVLFGMYGHIPAPEKALDAFLTTFSETNPDGTEMVGTPEEQHPSGLDDAIMKCQFMHSDSREPGPLASIPVCVWSDYSTVASVTVITVPVPSLGDAAQIAADLRRVVRVTS